LSIEDFCVFLQNQIIIYNQEEQLFSLLLTKYMFIMTQSTKREYQPPQIEQLQARVEKGYTASGQNPALSGDNAIQFGTAEGSWGMD
jgi:hypothetical protein